MVGAGGFPAGKTRQCALVQRVGRAEGRKGRQRASLLQNAQVKLGQGPRSRGGPHLKCTGGRVVALVPYDWGDSVVWGHLGSVRKHRDSGAMEAPTYWRASKAAGRAVPARDAAEA